MTRQVRSPHRDLAQGGARRWGTLLQVMVPEGTQESLTPPGMGLRPPYCTLAALTPSRAQRLPPYCQPLPDAPSTTTRGPVDLPQGWSLSHPHLS